MASSDKRQEFIESTSITGDGTTTSDGATLQARQDKEIAVVTVSSRTDGTYTLTVEHSADNVNFEQIATGSGISANGIESVNLPDRHLPYLRLKVAATSVTTGATVEAAIFSHLPRV